MRVKELTKELLDQILREEHIKKCDSQEFVGKVLTPEYVANFNRSVAHRIITLEAKNNSVDDSFFVKNIH